MLPVFIKTVDNVIWFAFNKINDDYLCFPKYLKSRKGMQYSEWYSTNIDISLKRYYKKADGLDEYVYLVNEKDIIFVYNPLLFLSNIKERNLKYNFEMYINNVTKMISRFFDIDMKYIGIEGSLLLDNYNENSDIDILVYGKENAKKIQRKFKQLNGYKNSIRLFSEDEGQNYMQKRIDCGYGKNLEMATKQFFRRYYGFFETKQFSIICVPQQDEDGYINLNRQIKFFKKYKGILNITDDDNSCIVPSVYGATDCNNNDYIIEVYNHYGINQLKKGEKVYIEGNEYLDQKDNKKIIILAFWNMIDERMDLYE